MPPVWSVHPARWVLPVRSTRLRRPVQSSLAGEAQSFTWCVHVRPRLLDAPRRGGEVEVPGVVLAPVCNNQFVNSRETCPNLHPISYSTGRSGVVRWKRPHPFLERVLVARPARPSIPMRRALTLASRRVAAFESRPPPCSSAVAWRPASHHRSCASSSKGVQTGPDASRGYNVSEYSGLWRTLNELEPEWPSSQTVAVVGPIGDGFAASALACAHYVVGMEGATVVSTQPRSRWQSVRLQVVCRSPDDVCELHSRLRALEGVRAVV